MKRLIKMSLLTILLGIFVLSIPGKANAMLSGYTYYESLSTNTSYNKASYAYGFIENDGKYTVKLTIPRFNIMSYTYLDIYLFDKNGRRIVNKTCNKNDLEYNTSYEEFIYTFPGTYAPGYYKIGAYGYSGGEAGGYDDVALWDNGPEINLPANPYKTYETINLAQGAKSYSGSIDSLKWNFKLYKLNATEDAMLNINNVKLSSEYSYEITVCKYDGEPAIGNPNPVEETSGYQLINKSGKSLVNYALKKGTYYVKVKGPVDGTYSFNLELRKYIHAKVKWSIKEGGINSSFPQNKTLHVTMQITNKDSDARFSKETRFNCAGYIDDDKITVSSDRMKGTFTFKTRTFPTVDTINVYLNELTLSTEANKVQDMCLYTLDITTGISMTNFNIEAGPNYILFPDFRGTMFVDDGKTKVNVYLKVGKKWKKKFTANAGSNTPKRIKKLKPKKKYKVKIEIARKLSNGKTVKNSKVVTVKTGPKTKPVIASARVSNYKREPSYVPGHYDANFVWHKGYTTYNTSYTMTITLSKPLKGCKGLVYEGVKCKGSGTTFTFTVMHRNPPAKATVRGYSDEKYCGYTPVSNAKAVSRN